MGIAREVNRRWFERVCVKDMAVQDAARGKDNPGQEALGEALAAVLGTNQTLRELSLDGVKLSAKVATARRVTHRRSSGSPRRWLPTAAFLSSVWSCDTCHSRRRWSPCWCLQCLP